MFGFLNPRPHSDSYRQSYARLCLHQRYNYGIASLPFHSFEAVFLYELALDAGFVNPGVLPNARCCRLSRRENVTRSSDAEIGRFCASVGVLLASIKLDDDIRDSRSWLARSAKFVLKSRIDQCFRYFQRLDRNFGFRVKTFIRNHHTMELLREPKPMHEYVDPTAKAFGYVFSLAPFHGNPQLWRDIGERVGSAIIAYDCAVDWHRDRATGQYNPIADEAGCQRALEYSSSELRSAGELCRRHFGRDSRAASTTSRVAERVLEPVSCPSAQPTWRHGWRLIRNAFSSLATGQLALATVAMSNTSDTYGVQPDTGGPASDKPWKSTEKKRKARESGDGRGTGNPNRDECCLGSVCAADCCCETGACCEIAACCA